MKCVFLVPGLDPRQGGVQVSAIDAIRGSSIETRGVVWGTDPNGIVDSGGIVESHPLKLVGRLLLKSCASDVAVFWHLSMLKLLPLMRARGFRGRVVAFVHGIEAWRPLSPSHLRKLEQVDLFLSNSSFTWNRFLDFSPQFRAHRHTVTPLGFGNAIPLETRTAPPAEPSVLIIARMAKGEDYKGHRQLIQAWPKIVNKVPDAKLNIVGEGDLKPELERLVAELHLVSKVIFHGRVSDAKKESLLKDCSIMAMPSRGEGFGIVYLEAMRFGRPCLVSNCDAGQEVVSPPEAGLAVDPDDLDELTKVIIECLTQKSMWEGLCRGAVERYQSQYTVAAFQQRLWKAIQTA